MRFYLALTLLCFSSPCFGQSTVPSFGNDHPDGGKVIWRGRSDDVEGALRASIAWEKSRWGYSTTEWWQERLRRARDRAARENQGNAGIDRRGQVSPLTANTNGKLTWNWSPPSDHHAAMCRVIAGNSGGSGGLVIAGKCVGILTAAHVVGGVTRAAATFKDGTRITGRVTVDKFRHDVAWIQVQNPPSHIKPIPIGRAEAGTVELNGFGGPEKKHRHYWANLGSDGVSSSIIAVSKVTSTYGDSGGLWVQNGFAVGVNSTVGGSTSRHVMGADGNKYILGDRARSPSNQAVVAFVGRVINSGFG